MKGLCVCSYLPANAPLPTHKNTFRAGLLVELVTFKGCGLDFSKEMKPPHTEEARQSSRPQTEANPRKA